MPYSCTNSKCDFTTSNVELYKKHQKTCGYNENNVTSRWKKDKRNKNRIISDPGPRIKDNNVNPTYYKGRDVMDIINRYKLSFCLGNVVKYVLRSKEKGGKIDLEKALWYLKEEISKLELKSE